MPPQNNRADPEHKPFDLKKKCTFWIILLILLYGGTELLSSGGLFYLRNVRNVCYTPVDVLSGKQKNIIEQFIKKEFHYLAFHRVLGWTIKENGAYQDLYRANADGIRADREYSRKVPADMIRITAFGDSFTHCDDVPNDGTWQVFMEKNDPSLEVINFGVGGYALDQAYLRYKEHGSRYTADVVFIGFMSENIFRMVNTFRPFYIEDSALPLAKPRFTLNSSLKMLPTPLKTLDDYRMLLKSPDTMLPRIGSHDYFYHRKYKSGIFDWSPTVRMMKISMEKIQNTYSTDSIFCDGVYNKSSEAFAVTAHVFDAFYESVLQNNAEPVIVVFPHKYNIKSYKKKGIKEYAALLAHFDTQGYAYVDLMDAFGHCDDTHALADLFVGHHYSVKANRMVAKHILEYMKRNYFKPKPGT